MVIVKTRLGMRISYIKLVEHYGSIFFSKFLGFLGRNSFEIFGSKFFEHLESTFFEFISSFLGQFFEHSGSNFIRTFQVESFSNIVGRILFEHFVPKIFRAQAENFSNIRVEIFSDMSD